jgi:hypothetical protein
MFGVTDPGHNLEFWVQFPPIRPRRLPVLMGTFLKIGRLRP